MNQANPQDFLSQVARHQRSAWRYILAWVICLGVFLITATRLFRTSIDWIFYALFYLNVCLLYIPMARVIRMRCPYCHKVAGVNPFCRYKFLVCRGCSARIERGRPMRTPAA